jgi:hypothetical protein
MEHTIDYTTVPVGLKIEGRLWTGKPTTFTDKCPRCGRIGVGSVEHNAHHIIVHTGRVNGNILEGIDYCRLELH